MKEDKILRYIEDILDVGEGTLAQDSILREYEEWDSLAIISFLAWADAQFHKTIHSSAIKNAVTVGDLLKLI